MSSQLSNMAAFNQMLMGFCNNSQTRATLLYRLCIADILESYKDCLKDLKAQQTPQQNWNHPCFYELQPSDELSLRLKVIGHWLNSFKTNELEHAEGAMKGKTISQIMQFLCDRIDNNAEEQYRFRPKAPLIMQTGDFTLRALSTEKLFDDEAMEMNSCLYNNTHLLNLFNANFLYFSIRNAKNRTIATLLVNPKTKALTMVEGWKTSPSPFAPLHGQYWAVLKAFMDKMGWGNETDIKLSGIFVQNNKLYNLFNLEAGLTITSSKYLTLKNNLDNSGSYLILSDPEIHIPDNTTIQGDLSLRGRNLLSIGSAFTVKKLDLRGIENTIVLPDDMEVETLILPDSPYANIKMPHHMPKVNRISFRGHNYSTARQADRARKKAHKDYVTNLQRNYS